MSNLGHQRLDFSSERRFFPGKRGGSVIPRLPMTLQQKHRRVPPNHHLNGGNSLTLYASLRRVFVQEKERKSLRTTTP